MALMDACDAGEIKGEVKYLISDNPTAPVLATAAARGIPTWARRPSEFTDKEAYEEAIVAELAAIEPDLICLAGYMRIVGAPVLAEYEGRIINIHPALLPSFPGLNAQRQALEGGVKISGCTVHFVDAGMDTGPIIAQTAVPVLDDDDEESLAARILEQEHPTYIAVAAAFCRDELKIKNGRVHGMPAERRNE